MNNEAQNIIMITAGGVGARFGADMPKQYMLLNGMPVISYVIEACRECKLCDAVVVAADPIYHEELRALYKVDVTASGSTLNITKRNGLDYIHNKYNCKKIIVADAVRPTIDSATLDKLFTLLGSYDAVACARKITDSLGSYNKWIMNRDEFYTLNAPEGFIFSLIDKYFNPLSPITESIQQLPETINVYLDFDIPYFDKITYPEDLIRLEALLQWKEKHKSA